MHEPCILEGKIVRCHPEILDCLIQALGRAHEHEPAGVSRLAGIMISNGSVFEVFWLEGLLESIRRNRAPSSGRINARGLIPNVWSTVYLNVRPVASLAPNVEAQGPQHSKQSTSAALGRWPLADIVDLVGQGHASSIPPRVIPNRLTL